MNEARRTLLKGLLSSAAISAVGLPTQSFAAYSVTAQPMTLLLTGTPMDAMFLMGAEAAAAESGQQLQTIASAPRAGIIDLAWVSDFLQAHRGSRVAGLMDDASYVLFSAMARDAGVALLAEGRHAQYAQAVSRHELRVTTSLHGAAEVLVAGLVRSSEHFSVAELPFSAPSVFSGRDWSVHGFDSYRVGGERPLCLHLAGLPLASACAALELPSASAEPVARVFGRPPEIPARGEWPALLGYALYHAGCGGVVPVPGTAQMFLRGDAVLGQHGKRASLVSFVVDL